jgi:hypothetical protein
MTGKYRIELNVAETALLEQIELDGLKLSKLGYERVKRNGELAAELTRLLSERGAIPTHRLAFFRDPDYNVGGRNQSREQLFERSLTMGTMLEHPNFLKYLRYFIHGPELPDAACTAFAGEIAACGQITSGDIEQLTKAARNLVRQHGLEPKDAGEEFFKLALEHGLDASYARMIRDHVRKTR